MKNGLFLSLFFSTLAANAATVCVVDVKETVGRDTHWKSRNVFDLGENDANYGYRSLAILSESNPEVLEEKEYRSNDEIARAKAPSTDWSEDLALSHSSATVNGEVKDFNFVIIASEI